MALGCMHWGPDCPPDVGARLSLSWYPDLQCHISAVCRNDHFWIDCALCVLGGVRSKQGGQGVHVCMCACMRVCVRDCVREGDRYSV